MIQLRAWTTFVLAIAICALPAQTTEGENCYKPDDALANANDPEQNR